MLPSMGAMLGQVCEPKRSGRHRTSTLLLGTAVPAGETGRSDGLDGLDPGAGPTGLDRWLGFCSDKPAAFFLWAAIWDKTLSTLPPEETETGMTTTGLSTPGPGRAFPGRGEAAGQWPPCCRGTAGGWERGCAGTIKPGFALPWVSRSCGWSASWIDPQWPLSLFPFHQGYP